MATTAKAQKIAAEMYSNLKLRCDAAGLDIAQSTTTAGLPMISIGDGNNGNPNAVIVISPVEWSLAKNSLGSTAEQFVPHMAMLATEAGSDSSDESINPVSLDAMVLGEILFRGLSLDWYLEDNGTEPTETTFDDPTKLHTSYNPNLYYPLTAAGQ